MKYSELDPFELLKVYLNLYCLHLSWITIDNGKIKRHGFDSNFPSFEEALAPIVYYNGPKWKERAYASEYTYHESRIERHYRQMNWRQ